MTIDCRTCFTRALCLILGGCVFGCTDDAVAFPLLSQLSNEIGIPHPAERSDLERAARYGFADFRWGHAAEGGDLTRRLSADQTIGVNNLKDANSCLVVKKSSNGISLENTCNFTISFAACYLTNGEAHHVWGYRDFLCTTGQVATYFLRPVEDTGSGRRIPSVLNTGEFSQSTQFVHSIACEFPAVPHRAVFDVTGRKINASCNVVTSTASLARRAVGSTSLSGQPRTGLPQSQSQGNSQSSRPTTDPQMDRITQASQQLTQERQARADAASRSAGRKTHDPAAEAHDCLSRRKNTLYGGFVNSCGYEVHYAFCNMNPTKDSWASSFNCENRDGIGAWQVGGNREAAAHTNGAPHTYWFACKAPAYPGDLEYVPGQGLVGRCR